MRCFSFLGSWIEVVCKNREGYSRMGEICDEPELENSEDEGCNEERIVVSVRLRPLNWKEMERRDAIDWECIDDNTIIYRNSVSERSNFPNAYTFDRVFRPDCPTKQVYEEAAKKVALSVVSGINASIFAYGQTSSGKTYTMSGVTEYTVEDIYDYVQRHVEREFILKFSAMEIYNEAVRDLLNTDCTPLRLLDDPERGTVVDRLTEETLRDLDHLKELLYECATQRQIGETNLNEASSRSHQILRLTIESCAHEFSGKDKSSTLTASVDFVDLAGSERASQALSAGTRLKEGCHINRSLLSLGTVIRKLSKGRTGHVPYRDSKLTRILQCSLGGNARTAIICTISPARSHVEQSRNTLQFASCAKEVTTNAQVNVVMSDKALVKQLQKELVRLQGELRGSKRPSAPSDPVALLRERDLQIQRMDKKIEELVHQRDLAQSRLETLVNIGVDQISVDWARSVQPPRMRAPLTISDEDDLMSESSGLTDRHLDVEFTGYDTTQYYSGYSEINSDDPSQQLSETSVDQFLSESISPRFSTSATKFVAVDPEEIVRSQKLTHETEENTDQNGKKVQCVEKEELIVTGAARDMVALVSTPQKGDEELRDVQTKYHVLEKKHQGVDHLHDTKNGEATDQTLASSPQKGDEKLREVQTNYDILEKKIQNVDRTADCHVNTLSDESSPLLSEEDLSSSKSLELTENGAAPAQALTSSPQKGNENSREVQTGYVVLERELNNAHRTFDCHVNTLSDESSPLLPEEHLSSSESTRLSEDGATTNLASSLSPEQRDEELREAQTEYGILEKKLEDVQKTVDGIVCPLPDEVSQLLMEEDLSGSKSLKLIGNEATKDQALSSSPQKRDEEIRDLETEFGILEKELQNMQKTIDRRANALPGGSSPLPAEEDLSNSESLKLTENVEKPIDSLVSPDEPSSLPLTEDLCSSKSLKLIGNEATKDQALSSSPQKRDEEIRDLDREFGILEKELQNMQKTIDRCANALPGGSSPLPAEEDLSNSESLKLTENVEKPIDSLVSPDEPSSLPLTEDLCSSRSLELSWNEAKTDQALSSSPQKKDEEIRDLETEYGILEKELLNMQKTIERHVNTLPDESSPLPPEQDFSSSRSLKLTENVEKTIDCLDSPLSDGPSPLPSKSLKSTGNGAESDHALSSSPQKGDEDLREVQTKCGVLEKELPDGQKIVDCQVDPLADELGEPLPLPTVEDLSSSRKTQLSKSRSCRASMMTSLPTVEQTTLNDEIDFPGRPADLLRKYSSSNFSPSSSMFSREDSFTSEQSTSSEDPKVHDIATPSEEEINRFRSFVSGLKEMSKLEYVKGGVDDQGQETASKTNKSERTAKDVGVETVQDHVGSPSNWPLEFERQQREIIELWQACNVSLVHRTYFFLLFKGDQSDSIYLEVERRRLSFLKDRMSQGNNSKLVMKGVPDHTTASSMRALRREREMLTKQMLKRLSEEERLNLYKKFGIALNTKQRRQQLARRLWTDTQDMNHIKESATLVARLVGLLEPGQALKEMFCLSFTPQEMSRRSHSWKGGRASIL